MTCNQFSLSSDQSLSHRNEKVSVCAFVIQGIGKVDSLVPPSPLPLYTQKTETWLGDKCTSSIVFSPSDQYLYICLCGLVLADMWCMCSHLLLSQQAIRYPGGDSSIQAFSQVTSVLSHEATTRISRQTRSVNHIHVYLIGVCTIAIAVRVLNT